MIMKKYLLTLGKIAVTVGLVFWLAREVDWTGVGKELQGVSWPLLFLYAFLQLFGNVISAKKWQIISSYKGFSFSLKEGFFTYMTGAFINNFLPSTIGGDTYRGLWLAKRSGARAAAVSTVIFDRFIGLWTTALLGLILSFPLWMYIPENTPLVITLLALLGFLVLDFIVACLSCQPWFSPLLEKLPFQKVRRLLQEVIFYSKRKMWLETSLWSAMFIFVGLGLSNYVLFLSLGTDVSFLPFFSVILLVAIVSSIPLSINNIGIKEWTYVVFFGLIGISPEVAVTAALLSRFIQMIMSFIAVPHYLGLRKLNRTQAQNSLSGKR